MENEEVELTKLEKTLWDEVEPFLKEREKGATTSEIRSELLRVQEDGSVRAPKKYRGNAEALQRKLNNLKKKLEKRGDIVVEEEKTSGRIPSSKWVLI